MAMCQVVIPHVLYRLFTRTHRTLGDLAGIGSDLSREKRGMNNTPLIRQICGRISRETDERKMEELLLLLNAVILNDLEDARTRMEFLRREYAIVFPEPTVDDTPEGGSHD